MNFLKNLFGRRKKTALEPPIEFLQAEPPDWLIELDATDLPGEGSMNLRARLSAARKIGAVEMHMQPGRLGGETRQATIPLLDTEVARLLVLLGFSFPDDIAKLREPVKDGLPARLLVHRREPYTLKEAELNLDYWLNTKRTQPPTAEVAMLLVGAKNRLFPSE